MTNILWKQSLGMGLMVSLIGSAACSNSATQNKKSAQPDHKIATEPVQFVTGSVGFASFESKEVMQAAMTYPIAKETVPEAPISLTADDGTGLVLESLDAQAVIEGPLAFTELRMRFRNPQSRVLEGRFQITLPEGASVSRLAMRMTDGWREAEVVERMAARRAYEDFLHRKQDPMLLEKEAGNQFRARIFPIPANGVKEVIVSFSHELNTTRGYTLPLRGLPAIADLNVSAMVAEGQGASSRYTPHEMNARGTVPTKDFHVETGGGLMALRHGSNVVARVSPEFSVSEARPLGVTILFDTSASRAPGFSRQVKRLGSVISAMAEQHGDRLQVQVAAFDQEVTPVFSGTASDFGQDEIDLLLSRRPLGASDLSGAMAWAGQQVGSDRLLIIGDGVVTAGSDDVASQAKILPKALQRIDMLLVGGIRDISMARRLVSGTRAQDGVVLREDLSDAEIVRRLGAATASVDVKVAGASWVWPKHVDGLQPGDELVVYAGFPKGKAAPKKLSVQLLGSKAIAGIDTVTVPGPLLERSAMAAQVSRLQGQYIETLGKKEKSALRAQIVDLSTRHRILSEHTALLVLESESDYARFGIERTALSDILRVGKSGLVLEQRNSLVIAATTKTPAPSNEDFKKKAKKDSREEDKEDERPESKSYDFEDDDIDGDLEAPKTMSESPGDSVGGRAGGERDERRSRRPRRVPAADRVGADAMGDPDDFLAEAPAAPPPPPSINRPVLSESSPEQAEPASAPVEIAKQEGPPALSGQMAKIYESIERGKHAEAVAASLRWRSEESGNVMALVALGESLEAAGKLGLAARAYGSIIDLFPSRADLRRFASARLIRVQEAGAALSVDSLQRAAKQRPDHLSVHRLLAYALVRTGELEAAFKAIQTGLKQQYPSGRFAGGLRILQEDLGIIAAAWLAKEPNAAKQIEDALKLSGVAMATKSSTRFVLNWETDANDVDFHIYDGKGGHAYYSSKELPSGGALFEDVTTGYGPECFAIEGKASQYPYKLQIHYYSRGPMGYGMGQVEVMQHDGSGGLRFDQRPFVVMNDQAFVDLGTVDGPLL